MAADELQIWFAFIPSGGDEIEVLTGIGNVGAGGPWVFIRS